MIKSKDKSFYECVKTRSDFKLLYVLYFMDFEAKRISHPLT